MIGDEDAETPFELLRDKNLLNEMDGLSRCSTNARRKSSLTFGLNGGKPKTLEDVARIWVTRERIRQLQNIALAKLRRALSKKEDPAELLSQLRKINDNRCGNTWPASYPNRRLVCHAQSLDRCDPRTSGRVVFSQLTGSQAMRQSVVES